MQNLPLKSAMIDLERSSLRKVYAALFPAHWITSFLKSLPAQTLTEISCRWPVPQTRPDLAKAYRDQMQNMRSVITNQQETLQRIEILRAWGTESNFAETFNNDWKGVFSIRELVLGTMTPSFYESTVRTWAEKIPHRSLEQYLFGVGYSAPAAVGRWGFKLQRVRIDHIEVDSLDLDGLSGEYHLELRVLMLCPSSTRRDDIGKTSSLAQDREFSYEKLAADIADHALPALRVIVIGPYWFWLEHYTSGELLLRKVWNWDNARKDTKQGREMFAILNDSDWRFLTDTRVPRYGERDHMEWNMSGFNKNLPAIPSTEMINTWNYMTALPEK
jgi:hypothetical protein